MSDHQLSLPEGVYQHLLAAAAMEGITPVDWIATHLPPAVMQRQSAPGDIADIIGSIDSRNSRHASLAKAPFEKILIEKMAKQGVHLP